MSKLTKNQKLASEKIEAGKTYSLKEAAQLVKEVTFTNNVNEKSYYDAYWNWRMYWPFIN